MRIKITGRYYDLTFGKTPNDADGLCDAPTTPRKRIRINSALAGQRLLTVLIHEMLHAASWSSDEEWVEQTAEDLATVLWRLRGRFEAENTDPE